MDGISEKVGYKHPGEHVYQGVVFSGSFPAATLEKVKHYQFQSEDVLVATYPKSGTTWMQEIVWLIVHDADIEGATNQHKDCRIPFLEMNRPTDPWSGLDRAAAMTGPKVLKTHLSADFFEKEMKEKQFKTVVVMRNLKDTLTSYYHFYQMNPRCAFSGSWNEFFEMFTKKLLCHGDWAEVSRSWWKMRENDNILIIAYEDMKENIAGVVRKVAQFLNKSLMEEEIRKIVQHTKLENMRQNAGTAGPGDAMFYRKGVVGDWKTLFNPEQVEFTKEYLKSATEYEGLLSIGERDL